jgi:beta-aspartyl-peptidase (threonine type)
VKLKLLFENIVTLSANLKPESMKSLLKCLVFLPFLLILSCKSSNKVDEATSQAAQQPKQEWAIVIHGGAGGMMRERMSPDADKEYRDALQTAMEIGVKILASGGTALDAVEKTVNYMEDNPLFNAGKGAVLNHDGICELDASIMDGSNLGAGAVTCVTDIKNPITAARKVMTNSKHVMFSGTGASQFAKEQGLEIVDPSYFRTEKRYLELQRALQNEKRGTVGCCALDRNGNLAAGTSTGGITNKMHNRIGDTPIIGAGTYANNNTCAVSCTGTGEYFIRWTVAHDISALMEYRDLSVDSASRLVVMHKLVKAGGDGGVICLDKNGNVAMPFNTLAMFRGYATADGKSGVFIYNDEK